MNHAAELHVSHYGLMRTPVGELVLGGSTTVLLLIGFPEGRRAVRVRSHWSRDDDRFPLARAQLQEWFDGERNRFTFPMRLIGTGFQVRVWSAVAAIPFAKTATYREIAEEIGHPKASRAVGAANGANPLPIVVPCHRVIGSNGTLTGYGGGIRNKQWLLDHESRVVLGD